jgi:hypothetical protein
MPAVLAGETAIAAVLPTFILGAMVGLTVVVSITMAVTKD